MRLHKAAIQIASLALAFGIAHAQQRVIQMTTQATQPAAATVPASNVKKTAWGTPTLTDWNGIWAFKSGDERMPKVEPTPEYAPFLEAARKAELEGKEITGGARCHPPGVPGGASLLYGVQFVVQPERKEIIMLPEYGINRWIRIDGKHPNYIEPTFNGDAVAHWEGDTLVIDTIGITTKSILRDGARHSNKLHVVERWREIEPGVIQNKLWMEDSRAFKPVSWTKLYKRVPNGKILENFCENNVEASAIKNIFDAFEVMKEPEQN